LRGTKQEKTWGRSRKRAKWEGLREQKGARSQDAIKKGFLTATFAEVKLKKQKVRKGRKTQVRRYLMLWAKGKTPRARTWGRSGRHARLEKTADRKRRKITLVLIGGLVVSIRFGALTREAS